MATPTNKNAQLLLSQMAKNLLTPPLRGFAAAVNDLAVSTAKTGDFAAASQRWRLGSTPLADDAVFRPKGQPLFVQNPAYIYDTVTDPATGIEFRIARAPVFNVAHPSLAVRVNAVRTHTETDVRTLRTFYTPTPISTNLPDEFVEAHAPALQKWIEDADNKPYVQKARFFAGMGLHLNGSKGRWTVEMARGHVSLKTMNHWLSTEGTKYDGRYRETLEKNHRSAARQPGTGPGPCSCGTCLACGTRTVLAPAARSRLNSQMAQALWFGFNPAMKKPKPPLPRSAVTAGEIVAYRAWKLVKVYDGPGHLARVQQDKHQWRLTSMYQKNVWSPGVPIEGRPDDHGENGVHAWKDPKGEDFLEYVRHYNSMGRGILDIDYGTVHCIVTGSVKLWGDVVEHEKGYRAEFAKVNSIDWLFPNAETFGREQQIMEELRKLYGV